METFRVRTLIPKNEDHDEVMKYMKKNEKIELKKLIRELIDIYNTIINSYNKREEELNNIEYMNYDFTKDYQNNNLMYMYTYIDDKNTYTNHGTIEKEKIKDYEDNIKSVRVVLNKENENITYTIICELKEEEEGKKYYTTTTKFKVLDLINSEEYIDISNTNKIRKNPRQQIMKCK